jgi:hypothetical protein
MVAADPRHGGTIALRDAFIRKMEVFTAAGKYFRK